MNSRVEEVIEASKQAQLGLAKCRNCGEQGAFSDFIVVTYGGGVAYAMCMNCAAKGHTILIRRGIAGIEVLGKKNSVISIGCSGINVIEELKRAKSP